MADPAKHWLPRLPGPTLAFIFFGGRILPKKLGVLRCAESPALPRHLEPRLIADEARAAIWLLDVRALTGL